MSTLLSMATYGTRDDSLFIKEMNALTVHHIKGSREYSAICTNWQEASKVEDLPFLHVGLFKHLNLKTISENIIHQRTLHSSSTSGISSKIFLDKKSASLHSKSAKKILEDFLGSEKRPLLVIDSVKSLYRRGDLNARVAAALSLKTLSSEIYFLLDNAEVPESMKWDLFLKILKEKDNLLVYGFSWILWLAWAKQEFPREIKNALSGKKIHFVHSGGWKKLESIKVDRAKFNERLLFELNPSSMVLDYYGLVEQVGMVYPLCEYGFRHVPVWADVIIRDTYTLRSLIDQPGQIQLLNTLAFGAPYHSILTEDIGKIVPSPCDCGRSGKKFQLMGRIPKAELRGCANV